MREVEKYDEKKTPLRLPAISIVASSFPRIPQVFANDAAYTQFIYSVERSSFLSSIISRVRFVYSVTMAKIENFREVIRK